MKRPVCLKYLCPSSFRLKKGVKNQSQEKVLKIGPKTVFLRFSWQPSCWTKLLKLKSERTVESNPFTAELERCIGIGICIILEMPQLSQFCLPLQIHNSGGKNNNFLFHGILLKIRRSSCSSDHADKLIFWRVIETKKNGSWWSEIVPGLHFNGEIKGNYTKSRCQQFFLLFMSCIKYEMHLQ